MQYRRTIGRGEHVECEGCDGPVRTLQQRLVDSVYVSLDTLRTRREQYSEGDGT